MRRLILVVGSVGLAIVLMAPAARAGDTAGCGNTWGSQPKSAAGSYVEPLVGARTERTECFDRLILDMSGGQPGYTVEYVPVVTQEGSGDEFPIRGDEFLSIRIQAHAFDDDMRPTVPWVDGDEMADVAGFSTFRGVVFAGSFEGTTTIGLGVRERLPFRVSRVAGPGAGSQLLIDVAHRWVEPGAPSDGAEPSTVYVRNTITGFLEGLQVRLVNTNDPDRSVDIGLVAPGATTDPLAIPPGDYTVVVGEGAHPEFVRASVDTTFSPGTTSTLVLRLFGDDGVAIDIEDGPPEDVTAPGRRRIAAPSRIDTGAGGTAERGSTPAPALLVALWVTTALAATAVRPAASE